MTGACFSTLIFTSEYLVTKNIIYFHTAVLIPFMYSVHSTNCSSVHRVQLQFTDLYLRILLSDSSGKKILLYHLRCDQ